MSRSNVRRLPLAIAAAAVLVWWGCSRCHTGHYQIDYYPESTSVSCDSFNEDISCTTDTDPEHCSAWFVCDVHCEALDKGRTEAHEKHPVLRQANDVVDTRCAWNGSRTWVK